MVALISAYPLLYCAPTLISSRRAFKNSRIKVWDEYILVNTPEPILALVRVFVNEYSFTARVLDTREYFYSNEYEYLLRASICIPYGYVDLKYMIYAIYMIDLGH